MQEVERFGRVGESRDHWFEVDASPNDEVRFAIEPVQLRPGPEPGSVTLSKVIAVGSTVAIEDLRHALDLVERAA